MSSAPVITAYAAVSPLGLTANEMWQKLQQGQTGIAPITAFNPESFPCQIAGQVPDFKVRDFVPKSFRKSVKLMCRDIELAVLAADAAFRNSGLVTAASDPDNVTIDPTRTGVNLGAGLISCDLIELAPAIAESLNDGRFDMKKWGAQGLELVTPLWLLKYLPNMLACHIGIIHDLQGPSNTHTCAEAGGNIAIIEAARIIERNAADCILAGGAEAKVNPILITRQCLINRAATGRLDPETSLRPFDRDAKGSIFGEAAATVLLENRQKALDRGAKVYAQLAGLGQSHSIDCEYHRLDSKSLQVAIEKALNQAQISPDQIDLIIPHGTAIPEDDLAEATAINNALGPATAEIPVFCAKPQLSNTGAAAGPLDIIAAIQIMENSLIPATKNFENPRTGCTLNILRQPRQTPVKCALCTNYTYGGQTTAIILKKASN